MRVLVTGATGFIGQALVPALVSANLPVRGLGRSPLPGLEWHQGDLTEASSLQGCCADIDTVFHLAGVAHTRARASLHEEVTVQGTRNLVKEARAAKVRQFIFVSSIKAGHSEGSYAQSRRAAEDIVREAGFPASAVVRPALVYGPGMRGNLAHLLNAAARGLALPIPRGGAVRSLVHRDDLVAVLIALMHARPSFALYTVTDGQPYALWDIYDAMRKGFGYRSVRYSLPQGSIEKIGRFGDRISAVIGRPCPWDSRALAPVLESSFSHDDRVWHDLALRPRYSLASALPELAQDYRNRPHKSAQKTGREERGGS